MRVTVSAGEFARVLMAIPEHAEAAVIRGLKSTAARGVGIMVEEIQKANAVNTGGLVQSVAYESALDGADVAVNAPHAAFLEYGTRPHFPPVAPVFEWVMRKLRPVAEDGKSAEEVGMGIARAICLKISRDGTAPRWYARSAAKRIYFDVLPDEISREMEGLK